MRLLTSFCLGLTVLSVAACSGTSSLGRSELNQSTGDQDGGDGSGGMGNPENPGTGARPGNPMPATGGRGALPEACTSTMDCPITRAVCTMCADGTYSCPSYECVMNTCVLSAPPCAEPSPVPCMTAEDCPDEGIDFACDMCADGTMSCGHFVCENAACKIVPPSCEAPLTSCSGMACGDRCNPCPPASVPFCTPAWTGYCNEAGGCQQYEPMCGGG